MPNVINRLQASVKSDLLAIPEFSQYGISVIESESKDFATLIQQGISVVDRPTVLIAFRRARNDPPGLELEWNLVVSEVVPINREQENYLTGLDVICLAVEKLDGHTHRWTDFAEDGGEEGIFVASATFKTKPMHL